MKLLVGDLYHPLRNLAGHRLLETWFEQAQNHYSAHSETDSLKVCSNLTSKLNQALNMVKLHSATY